MAIWIRGIRRAPGQIPSSLFIESGLLRDGGRIDDGRDGGRIDDGRDGGRIDSCAPGDIFIDGSGLIALPGLVDVHVHLREPGFEHKETALSGTRAAVAGGVTSLAAMPNTEPAVDSPDRVMRQLRLCSWARIFPVAALTKERRGEELVDMGACLDAGAVAFSDDGSWLSDPSLMARALEFSGETGTRIISHCEKPHSGCVISDGPEAERRGLTGVPREIEVEALQRDIALLREHGGNLHAAHISCRESLELIRAAKDEGLSVTCEVTPHHLLLTSRAIDQFGTKAKVNPPLRAKEDSDALISGLAEGVIDVIATDHAPHSTNEKSRPFIEAPCGISSIDILLPLLWTELVLTGRLSFERLIEACSATPARLFGLNAGSLSDGAPADLVLFDPSACFRVNPDDFFSKGRNCPFEGMLLQGRVVFVLVGGMVCHGVENFPQSASLVRLPSSAV